MSEKLKELRERSQKRKKLLAQTVSSVNITYLDRRSIFCLCCYLYEFGGFSSVYPV